MQLGTGSVINPMMRGMQGAFMRVSYVPGPNMMPQYHQHMGGFMMPSMVVAQPVIQPVYNILN